MAFTGFSTLSSSYGFFGTILARHDSWISKSVPTMNRLPHTAPLMSVPSSVSRFSVFVNRGEKEYIVKRFLGEYRTLPGKQMLCQFFTKK